MSLANAVNRATGEKVGRTSPARAESPGRGRRLDDLADIQRERGEHRLGTGKPRKTWNQRAWDAAHRLLISDGTIGAKLLTLKPPAGSDPEEDTSWRHGLRYGMLGMS